ncbi:MAG: hypothetical protein K6D97_02880 [Clostridia bacterium]|nr:hypothetical protein [Clostridia bacterium]
MIINFDKVYERDIDLYAINNFCNDSAFLELFQRKINKKNYRVYSAESSLEDIDGESDITIVLENEENYCTSKLSGNKFRGTEVSV